MEVEIGKNLAETIKEIAKTGFGARVKVDKNGNALVEVFGPKIDVRAMDLVGAKSVREFFSGKEEVK